ncbi:precorrin-8X methylmutase [Blastococcus sp. Marseille-P5729]|uniref:precorrin-8X methylmutase n=1 Tax=Blastococcus sp. Marseille-P5729 TaxID=2086582 RepID=UPI000D10BB1E|nr:precorrin-8X methylmutase [Blastococcus sp. Marseille-P5729]
MNQIHRPARAYEYETDGQEIYRQSFGMIRDEARARLSALPDDVTDVAVRIVHAAGDVAVADQIAAHPDVVRAARSALRSGAPILADSNMVAHGVTRRRLPADNEVICLLRDDRVPALAREWQTTRSAAAVSLWADRLEGAVVAVGNAPTALFHLLEMLEDPSLGTPRPAAIVGMPVGFVGSAESKTALAEHELPEGGQVPWIVVHGRRGGSAMAAAALNALAHESELA